jgi:ribosomal-protein-alanine N-acetyltransferase
VTAPDHGLLAVDGAAVAAPGLAALHAAAFPPAQAWGAAAIGLMLELRGSFGLWRPEAGFVLARVAADEAEILTLAVLPAARRQGLGAALMAAAMATARARGATAMFLEVAEANAAALALYRGLGFAEVGRRRRYYEDGADALVLRRALDADGAA